MTSPSNPARDAFVAEEPTTDAPAPVPRVDAPAPFPGPGGPLSDGWRTAAQAETPPPGPRWRLHLLLYLATWTTTFLVGTWFAGVGGGLVYCASIMTILTAHELGHYLQARRHRIPASPPFFIPLPLPPFGTLGAVIAMRPQRANARSLFDLAITGPLAGLVPTIAFSLWGLRISPVVEFTDELRQSTVTLGEPAIFKLLSYLAIGPTPEGHTVLLHPMAYAGWVGIFITALNLVPISQSDGGHILFTLVPRYAHRISLFVFGAACVAVLIGRLWNYLLLVVLLALVLRFIGFKHPPLADDSTQLDRWRVVLGWLTLTLFFLGLSPIPMTGPPT